MTNPPIPPAWFDDPLEVDRYLEEELDPATRAERDEDVSAGRVPAERLARRERELSGLRGAGTRWRRQLAASAPEDLEKRVRAALSRDRLRGRRRWIPAAAAVLLLALGLGILSGRPERAEAMPPEVLEAADAAKDGLPGPGRCDVPSDQGPEAFPCVQDGSLRIWGCRVEGPRTIARLYRPEDLPSVGYAAVADEDVERGPDLGRTDLGTMVVFDLVYGRKRHYLAVNKAWLEDVEREHPGRASCRACHHLSREGQKNPHNIVARSWRLGG